MLGKQFPVVESMLRDTADDVLAFAGFPVGHWKKIWSTNPLERVNKEIPVLDWSIRRPRRRPLRVGSRAGSDSK